MPARAWVYLLGCNLLAGTSYVAMTYVLRGFSTPSAVFWRLFLGAILLAPSVRRQWPAAPISRGDWLRIAGVGVFGLALPLMIGTMGLSRSTATNASLLLGLEPVSILILSALFLGEALPALKVGAIACGLLGSSLIVLQGMPWNARLTPHWRGDVLLVTHAALWSLYSVLGKSALRRVPPAVFTGLTTAIAVLPLALAAGPSLWPSSPPPAAALAGLAFQAAGVTYGATLLWNKGLELVPASTMAQFIFLQPLTGVLLGVLLNHDPLSAWSAGGGLLILAGVTLASR